MALSSGHHEAIEKLLKCRVYFTDINSPQQRDSNENLNGLVREYFPKGRSLAHVDQLAASLVALSLNRRSRKRLRYHSPLRVFSEMTGLPEAPILYRIR
jgi:transposase, IS30 family